MSASQVRTAPRVSMQAVPSHSNALRPTYAIHVIAVSRDVFDKKKRGGVHVHACAICVCGCVIVQSTEGCLVEQPVIRGVPNLIFA